MAVALYLSVQVAVPLGGLSQRGGFLVGGSDLTRVEGPAIRYGWQMFATIGDSADYEVRWPDGTTTTVNSVRLLGRIRGRAHHADVHERLCARLPAAAAVTRDGTVHPC